MTTQETVALGPVKSGRLGSELARMGNEHHKGWAANVNFRGGRAPGLPGVPVAVPTPEVLEVLLDFVRDRLYTEG
jgi:hypothetical protein